MGESSTLDNNLNMNLLGNTKSVPSTLTSGQKITSELEKDTATNIEGSAGSSADMEIRRRRLERFESLTKEQKKDNV